MPDISSIDGYANPWRSSVNRSPSQDFADELAKEDGKAQSDKRAQAKQDNETRSEARAQGEATTEQTTSTVRLVSGTALPGNSGMSAAKAAVLATVQEQLGVVVQPIGDTEALLGSRVFGLHLLAGAYLSELTLSEGATSEATFDAVKAVQSSTTSLEEQAAPLDSLLSEQTASPEDPSPVESLVVPGATVTNEASAAATDASPQTAAAMESTGVPAAHWLERSLRFTKQSDGSAVAWLRDYRADGHETAKLVDSLIQEAKANGSVLSRVMLNGREVWTSRNDT